MMSGIDMLLLCLFLSIFLLFTTGKEEEYKPANWTSGFVPYKFQGKQILEHKVDEWGADIPINVEVNVVTVKVKPVSLNEPNKKSTSSKRKPYFRFFLQMER